MAIPPYSDESTPTSTTTMSEAANEVNAALVAAVTAGEGSGAFTSAMDIDNIEVDKETLESIVAGNAPRLGKRPAEDDDDDDGDELESDSVKLRKLQEEVNNNANAAAQASGILTSTSLSAHTSNRSSPVHSTAGVEAHGPEDGHNDATDDRDTASQGSHQESPVASLPEATRLTLDKSQVEAALAAVAAAHPGLETSHQIMADLARIQQIAKIDPTQLASYSTNPNNQATLEQLTSSALANVLAQAPIENLNLHLSQQQSAREGDQQQAQSQASAVDGILASIPTSSPSAPTEGTVTATTVTATTSTTAPPPSTSSPQRTPQAAASRAQPQEQPPAVQEVDDSSEEEETIASKRAASRNMTNDERRQRRLLRNRMAAKECRKKKKAYVAELEDTVQRLKEENSRLHKEVEELNAKLTLGAMRIDENYRLIQEVEKLNAKLTLGMANAAEAHSHSEVGQHSQGLQQQEEEANEAEQAAVAAAAASHPEASVADTPLSQADGSPNTTNEAAEPNTSSSQSAMAEFIAA